MSDSLSILLMVALVGPILFIGYKRYGNSAAYRWMKINGNGVEKVRPIISQHFDYYRRLPQKFKAEFENKLIGFMEMKEFTPRQMKEVTFEMKVLISAAAVQLTFGLPEVYLRHFSRILVYPDDYYSTIFKRYHRGEVNLGGGIVVLSWKSFVKGYADNTDGLNLGLHEMAHALKLENGIFNQEYNFLDQDILRQWTLQARSTFNEIREGRETFFRNYAGASMDEFFSVVIENFFERSAEFKAAHPQLYKFTVLLLRQDPIRLLSLPQ